MKKQISGVLLFVFAGWAAFCQPNELYFNHLNIQKGLSQTTNYFIFKDTKGFVWISSQAGLNRFDGNSIRVYQPNPDNAQYALHNNNILSPFFEDKEGNIWFSTYDGIECYQRQYDRFLHDTYQDKTRKETIKGYYAMHLDSKGNLWVIIESKRLYFYNIVEKTFRFQYQLSEGINRLFPVFDEAGDPTHVFAFSLNPNVWGLQVVSYLPNRSSPIIETLFDKDNGKTPQLKIQDLYIESSNLVWIAADKGLYAFNPFNDSLKRHHRYGPVGLSDIKAIEPFGAYSLLVATKDKGLFFFDKYWGNFTRRYTHVPTDQNALAGNLIDALYTKDSTIWVSIEGAGVDYTNLKKARFERIQMPLATPESNTTRVVDALTEDKNGNLWYSSAGILTRISSDKKTTRNFIPNKPGSAGLPKSSHISHLLVDDLNQLWVLTSNKGIAIYNPTKQLFKTIPDTTQLLHALQLKDKTILIASSEGIFSVGSNYLLTEIPATKNDRTAYTFLYEDQDGLLWTCASTTAINIFDPKNGFKLIQTLPIEGIVNGFHHDASRGIVWIANENGLVEVNKSAAYEWKIYTEKDGLPNRAVRGLLSSRPGILWLSTVNGIAEANTTKSKPVFQKYSLEDGLSHPEFAMHAALLRSNGEMCFGSMNGITFFRPEMIKPLRTAALPTITKIRINDQDSVPIHCDVTGATNVSEIKKLVLSPTQRTISFEFSAMEYSAPYNIQFKYRMQGVDADTGWVNAGTNNFARYADLSPGKYTFLLQASNADGIFSASTTRLEIFIQKHWTQTLLFKTVIAFIIISIPLSFIYLNAMRLWAVEEARQEIASDLHDDVGSSLASIKMSSQAALDAPLAAQDDTMEKIFLVAQASYDKMQDLVWAIKAIKSDLDMINVLSMLRQDANQIFADSIKLQIHISDTDLNTIKIKSDKRYHLRLIYKEAFANILKYARATQVDVWFYMAGKHFVMKIKDNGIGMTEDDKKNLDSENGGGNGLSNMKKRASKLQGTFDFHTRKGEGTTVVVQFPLITKKKVRLLDLLRRLLKATYNR